ncbi:U6 snRNA phosphodiesterase 1 isoform X2 [Linepithema humile]|uniref:U6 snRNA phosphodiesterase 1 isoform X2 n=1 Tax=Linepithema humile TaxID=83485 RepID=UPI00062335C5|nr:PREDICTED: U6 snRNA phosphodiesterase isoform X2 [Linepithema humile]
MAGLDLIKTYSSDSEDEHDEKKKSNKDKIVNRLAIPTSILSWEGVIYHEEMIDDPLNHDGRKRSFKHERGNWATLIYINYVKVYCNEEKTRTFLGIYCQDKDGTLKHLTKVLDGLLAEYQLPSFYKDTSYHISIFWCLGDQRAHLQKFLPFLTCNLNKFLAENTEDSFIYVNEIQCKIGNKCYMFELR